MALVPFPSQNRDDEPRNLPEKGGFSPFGDHDEEPGEGRMTFLEHLDELRKRITHAVGGLLVGFIISFAFIGRVTTPTTSCKPGTSIPAPTSASSPPGIQTTVSCSNAAPVT